MNIIPFDNTNSTNPYLINRKDGLLVDNTGNKLTAEYIWSKQGIARDELVEWVFQYYRNNGFPKLQVSDNHLHKEYKQICDRDISDIINDNGEIKNSASSGSNIIKHFAGDLYYSVKGNTKNSKSCIDAFNDDDTLRNVLRNRMGYCFSKEDGTDRPYVFSMSDAMLIQGFRSSANGFATSQFKALVAKYIYKTLCPENGKIIDYSAGFGARALAAGSLNLQYTGIDPLTYSAINNMTKFFDINGKVIGGGSENKDSYDGLSSDYDFAFSSPPFFSLEVYSKDDAQSYNKYNEYNDWLNFYWKETVKNCINILKETGVFAFCMVNKVGKYNIAEDMCNITKEYLKYKNVIPIKTSRGHLSGKKESKQVSKTTENIYVFTKQ